MPPLLPSRPSSSRGASRRPTSCTRSSASSCRDQFWSEGANAGDLNNDGVNDIISGPWWWEGPGLHEAPRVLSGHDDLPAEARTDDDVTVPGFEGTLGKENKYSDNFFVWTYDFNEDGWNDILDRRLPRQGHVVVREPEGQGRRTGRGTRSSTRPTTSRRRSPISPATASRSSSASPKGRYGYAHARLDAIRRSRGRSTPISPEQQVRQLHARPGRRRRERRRPRRPAREGRLVGAAGVARRRSGLDVPRRSRSAPAARRCTPTTSTATA